jgi:hypothetical protein
MNIHHNEHDHTALPTLRERILGDITSGKVRQVPRVYYVFQSLLVSGLALLIPTLTIFICGFIFFSIRINSHDALLGFGTRGIFAFFAMLPWPLIILDVLLIILLRNLMRMFRIGYQTPSLYIGAGFLLITACLGFIIDHETDMNDRLHKRSHMLPTPVGSWYRDAQPPRTPRSGMCRCEVVDKKGNVLLLRDRDNGTSTLRAIIPDQIRRGSLENISVGDIVFVAGDEDGDSITVFGIRSEHHKRPRYWLSK